MSEIITDPNAGVHERAGADAFHPSRSTLRWKQWTGPGRLQSIDVTVHGETWSVICGDGVMPDLAKKQDLPAQTLIAIAEEVAHEYRRRGWQLPKEA